VTEIVTPPNIGLLAALESVGGIADEHGLTLPPDLPYERYESIGALLGYADRMINWYIADWLVYGEHQYGHKFHQAAEVLGKSPRTLINIQNVGRNVPPQRRRTATVDFWHHYEVGALPAADQRRILKEAETEGLTKMQVRDRAREAKGETVPRSEVMDRDICEACGRPMP
jgi:hypothetical protein